MTAVEAPSAADPATVLDRSVAAVLSLGPADLSAEVRARAVDTWCDAIAVLAGGATTEAAGIAADYARRYHGVAGLVCGGYSAAPWAAFANGTALAALDFEDGHAEGGAMHPASPVVSALLAAADAETTMASAWTAQVAGYELGLRVGRALLEHDDSIWFHATGNSGAVAAALAVAHLRGYDLNAARRAVHIAWLHAPFSTGGWPMIKESIGWGAMTGLVAADLAALGMNRLPVGYRPNDVNIQPETALSLPGALTDPFVLSIGTTFESLNTYFKPFASCRWTHSAAAGLRDLMRRHQITADLIERIVVETHEGATHLSELAPRTIEHGQYSFEMVLSAVALYGAAGWREMSVSAMAEPARRALAERVVLRHDPALDRHLPAKLPARVTVELRDGSRIGGLYLETLGENDLPMSRAELDAKWTDLLAARLTQAEIPILLAGLADPAARLLEVTGPLLGGETATGSSVEERS